MSAAAQPSLFDRLTAADRRRELARLQERLAPIVLAMAERYGAEGITASDVIAEAILGGILTGAESRTRQRAYSWVGPWLASLARAGKLKALAYSNDVPVRRRSERSPSHGNLQQVYVAPRFAAGGSHRGYRFEMTDDGHRELATCLRSLCGMVVVSGYACELYDLELYPDWERHERRHVADGARERLEVLWLNDACGSARSQQVLGIG